VEERFCSRCGSRGGSRIRFVGLLRPHCEECGEAQKFERWAIALAAALLFAFGFFLARLITPRQQVFLIGTPIEQVTSGREADDPAGNQEPAKAAPAADLGAAYQKDGICGAHTRSGRPCSRRVKGGGLCWQHRKKAPANEVTDNVKRSGDRVL
jgi:hypothetical protein